MSGVAGQTYNFDSFLQSTATTTEQSIAVQPYTELQFGGGDYYFYPLSYRTRLALDVTGNVAFGGVGRGLHSSTSQLNLSRFLSLMPQLSSTSQLNLRRFCR